MKDMFRLAAPLAVSALILAPLFAAAQATSTRDSDGSRYSDWRRQSNESQQKIQALGGVAEADIAMPVLFGVVIAQVSNNYGELRISGRIHEGLDIMAMKGTPIVSPTAAVVTRVDYGAGEGNAVYTANPGGERFIYYHLDRVGEGVAAGLVLERGSLIGYVGNTGDASGGAAHLHFEIRKGDGNAPTDPYPRLTREFTPAEKMVYLSKILTQAADPNALAQFLVTNFRATFAAALAAGAAVPPLISSLLSSVPNNTPPVSGSIPSGDLALGSSGSAVVQLQQFLIAKLAGDAAKRLSYAGATGYFGSLTQAALVDYQLAMGITPANGYYGPSTQAYVRAGAGNAVSSPPPPSVPPTASPGSGGASTNVAFTRNLYLGINGEDVRTLQKLLNRNGFIVASTGPGSLGNETTYFGPATKAAVIKYQAAHSISPAAGYVGPMTRASFALLPPEI